MDADLIARFTGPYSLPGGIVPVVDGIPRWPWDEVVARRRLGQVAKLAVLPDGVPGPAVLDYGRDRLMSWIVVKRVHAGLLWHAWRSEAGAILRSYVSQLAQIIRNLHSWQPPAQVLARYAAAECLEAEPDPVAIAASTLTRSPRV